MYPARKNTNINKHKFFHPGSGKNQAKLWEAEEKKREEVRDTSLKQKQIEAERKEIEQIKLMDPARLKSYQMKWMYEDKKDVKAESATEKPEDDGNTEKVSSSKAFPGVNRKAETSLSPEKKVRNEYAAVVQKRMRDAEADVKRREDPMALAESFVRRKRQ
mmetsp:Transcript_18791/g.29469  ORF Transcript_18791/g.29469 Transcript_18791/m.29469 type:complete len:161 (-) Transcript_18791:95-577(-)